MNKTNKMCLLSIAPMVALLAVTIVFFTKAGATPTTSTSQLGGSLVQSNSIITGEIKAIKSMTTGYSWEIDILVKSSQDVGTIKNPTSDKVGQVVQFRTDESTKALKVGQTITAHAKLTGDVEVGTTLYIYDIQ